MSTVTPARVPYSRRPVPPSYSGPWLATELGNLQRALPVSTVRVARSDDAPTAADGTVCYDATAGPIAVTLPAPSTCAGLELRLKKIDASAHVVTLVGTVDGTVNPTLATQYSALVIQSSGASWFLFGSV